MKLALKDLVRTDTAIGIISAGEVYLIGDCLSWVVSLIERWPVRWIVPARFREALLPLRLLAATLSKTRVEETLGPIEMQIQSAMDKDRRR